MAVAPTFHLYTPAEIEAVISRMAFEHRIFGVLLFICFMVSCNGVQDFV
ncbi:hypothetical protein HanXRQr2_Chr17g0824141 [Helianthus annuus]|uniref:Uncharacterized protein n=1 Tax=Helianthus annuus TaxID=4232 RepID=A0A9K3DM70_HELAN|nr:hypothetical protein HanXRQr2_Chr17g0824141 [Helianthus annuus]